MCLAVPRRVLESGPGGVLVDVDGRPTRVRTSGITSLRTGDYVLVYAGYVLERVSPAEAEELLAFYGSLEVTA